MSTLSQKEQLEDGLYCDITIEDLNDWVEIDSCEPVSDEDIINAVQNEDGDDDVEK